MGGPHFSPHEQISHIRKCFFPKYFFAKILELFFTKEQKYLHPLSCVDLLSCTEILAGFQCATIVVLTSITVQRISDAHYCTWRVITVDSQHFK